MALNSQFPNYANGAAGTEVIGWTVIGGQPLYRLPVAYVDTGFGAAFVCEGSTVEAPTYPEGVYTPDPNIESAGVISGDPEVGNTLTFAPGSISGTAPISATYNWIRYVPGGQSIIVGSGLSYVVQLADAAYTLIVQTVAAGPTETVATQTVPFGPCYLGTPIITDPGTISVRSQNVRSGSGAIFAVTLTNPGENYVYVLGPPTVTINGDGIGATAVATLAEEGGIIGADSFVIAAPNETGTITYTGENGETPAVLTWSSDVDGDVSVVVTNPGSGWTQANVTACEAGTYGTFVITNSGVFTTPADFESYVGVPLASVTLTNGGSGYTFASAVVTPVDGDIWGNGATVGVTLTPSDCPVPGDTLEYSGATVSFPRPFITYTTWINANDPGQVWQAGGDTFVIPDTAVGNEVAVKVVVFGSGSQTQAEDQSNAIAICGYLDVITPSSISDFDPVFVRQGLSGQPATFDSYGQPVVTYNFFDVTDPLNPAPLAPPNTSYYITKNEDFGKSIAFITNASLGILTAQSTSQTLGPVDGYLNVITRPTVSYTGDVVNPGTVLTGTPGIFDGVPAVTSVSSAFYRNTGTSSEPNWVVVNLGLTHTVEEADVGYDIAFGTTAVSPLYPGGVLGLSVPVRPTFTFVFTTRASYVNQTRPGQTPRVGDVIQMVYPESTPQNDKYGGTVPLASYFVFRKGTSESVISTSPYTVTSSNFDRDFFIRSIVNYGGNEYSQTTNTVKVGGVKPTILPGGAIRTDTPATPFIPGSYASFTLPTIDTGLPAGAAVNWTWFVTSLGGTRTPIQNGGLLIEVSKDYSGKTFEIDLKAENPAGAASETYIASVPVPAPKITISDVLPLMGKKHFEKNGFIDLSFYNATATDGVDKSKVTLTSTLWLTDALGNLFQKVSTASKGDGTYRVYDTLSFDPSSQLERPPGNRAQIPFPFVGRYVTIEWVAESPYGGKAVAYSPLFGPFTAADSVYGGITPASLELFQTPTKDFDCTLTMPTFNNGGSIDVSTLKVWTDSTILPAPLIISEGSLEFQADYYSLHSSGGSWFTATIKGPAGDVPYRQTIYPPS